MPDNPPDSTQRGWILAALMMTMMLAAMDTTIVSTAIPQIVADLGGFALFGWVFSIYLLAQTVTIPLYGKLADTFGRKPVLVIGIVIFLVGSVASALAWNMVALIGFRALQGLGAGSIMATVNTLAGDLYSVRERARVQGWLSSVWGVAAILGPTLGGAFAEYASWHWIFLINLPIGALALALITRFVHEQAPRRHHRIDYAGAALLLLAGSTLIFALLQGGRAWPWLSAPSAALFALTLALGVALVMVERRAVEPIQPRWLWRHPVLVGSNLSMIGMGLVMMGPSTYLPVFGQSVYGLGAIAAGFVLAALSLGWPAASALSPPLYARWGFRDTGLFGCALILLASLAFLWLPRPQPVMWVLLDQVLLGAGLGFFSTPILVGMQSTVGWGQRGVVTGSHMFARYLGQSLGAALFGAIFNAALGARLADAPPALAGQVPQAVDAVMGALHSPATAPAVGAWLRSAMGAATDALYVGMSVIAVLMLLVLLVAPRRFPVIEETNPSATR